MNEKPATEAPKSGQQIQGEGDYESTRRFRKDTDEFLKKANVEELARKAAPKSEAEAQELKKAEDIGRSHRADSKAPGSKP